MGKLVMGYWDCAFCGEKKIPGTSRACPSCGKVRGADAVFYMDDKEKEYLSDEQAATKGKGADWYCSYCDSLNSALDPVCKSCGATKEESERNYFELQEKKKQDAEKKEAQKLQVEQARENPDVTGKRRSRLPLILIPLLLIAVFIFASMPKTKDMKISDVYWHNVIDIEKQVQVEESDWSVPDGGEVQYTQREIQSYRQVVDHYDTETYSVEVQSGSHTEYEYRDNGDGTFEEVPYSVPDYTTEYRTREVPVYRNEPVYGTKYYYLIWKWVDSRSVETEGHDKNPQWGDVNLEENEREKARYSAYSVTGTKDDNTKEYVVSEEIWNKINVGDSIKCKVKGNTIIELE